MKNKLLFTILGLLLALCSNYGKAQEYEYVPFPTQNAIWSELFYYYGSQEYPNDTMNVKYALFDKDTVLFDKIWQKLYMVFDSVPYKENAELEGFLLEENKIIYYMNSNLTNGGKLYDFNAKVGDTITVNIPIPIDVRVYKIDSVNINEKLRKRFHLDFGEGMDFGIKWIEGIGSLNGILWPGTWPTNQKHELLCLKRNEKQIYYNNNYGTCYPDYPNMVNAIKDIKKQNKLNIYPNPAKNLLTVELNNFNKGMLKIFSFDGKIILEKQINNTGKQSINIENFHRGIYLIVFINQGNEIYKGKFIKM